MISQPFSQLKTLQEIEYGEVNRLIIVGNGFDLAHGFKSSFADFINAYCHEAIEKFILDGYYLDSLLQVQDSSSSVTQGLYSTNRILETGANRLFLLYEMSKFRIAPVQKASQTLST